MAGGERVDIRDVGPRDGLQPEQPVDVADRVALVDGLVAAGLRHIEVAAFVSPKAVPAMAGAAEVVAGVGHPEGVVVAALAPNLRGAVAALEAGVDELTVTVSASEAYNLRNVRMTVEETLAQLTEVCREAASAGPGGAGVPVDAVISCCFGSPYEGETEVATVVDLASALMDAGCTRCTYADTTGMATPRRIRDVLDGLDGTAAGADIGLHLHDTRGTGLVNAFTALERGVRRFDTAVGGLGGSPFAHGAGGNLATEELVALLDDLGYETGIDVEALIAIALHVGELVGRDVPSRVAHHGPRTRLARSGGGSAPGSPGEG